MKLKLILLLTLLCFVFSQQSRTRIFSNEEYTEANEQKGSTFTNVPARQKLQDYGSRNCSISSLFTAIRNK